MPHVYLIQPRELVGTDRYKIGMSSLDNLSRLRSYKNGSRYICFFECDDAREVEKKLIKEFNRCYKLIAGNEYFQCPSEASMIKLFMDIVLNHKTVEEKVSKIDWMTKFAYRANPQN